MTALRSTCFVCALFLLAPALFGADPVVGWRGDGTGVFPAVKPPLSWTGDESKRILWKTEVGESFSSPVIVGDRVLVTGEPDLLFCLDAASGKVLWKQATRFADLAPGERIAPPEPPATSCGFTTPTPISDGKRIWVVIGTGLVGCYNLAGKQQWVRYLGGDRSPQYGRSASPCLVDGKLIVHISTLIALDAASGKTLWKAPRLREEYGSPVAARVGNVPVAITATGEVVRAKDGKVLATGIGHCANATPVVQGRKVFFIDLDSRAVELPAEAGDEIEVKELWTADLEGEFFASPIVHDNLIHAVNNRGNFWTLDAATGKTLAEKKLTPPSQPGLRKMPSFYPSVTLAGSLLFVGNNAGGSLWLRPGRTVAEVGRNLLPEGAGGSPTFTAGRMYLRGGVHLYCIGDK